MVVLKNGVMVHEHYWNGTKEGDTHLMMSVTKSFTSILAAIAVDNGLLDMNKLTTEYLPELLETQIWQKIGVENDAEMMASANGGVMASGGLNASTKDLARVGKVILNEGKNYKGEQVIPKAFIDNIYEGNDKVRAAWSLGKEAALADGWYMNQFRILYVGDYKVMAMVGIHGQIMVADLESNTVIAMNGGYPMTETPRVVQGIFHKTIPAILDAVRAQ
ncbi:hypothetical protein C9J48_13365 [Photobacterium profundum]|uniref:Beta-lactamase-related domain-containing protein n=1 Tax=Photobacterium profundum 3TCK TaxID=314280 RepID=Q1Z3D0_9GAMM|nr:serine hydrolase [Photobacterium profundum]EAS43076.1 hypothetical protein P3TCK_11539 [Photobacterium profundum 3TCK]PSV61972.1 hypothetical protein C9J48_13365 [Photobacterium profundum]